MGEHNFLFTVGGMLARVLLAQGRDDEASAVATRVRRSIAWRYDAQALWRQAMARILARRGEDDGPIALAWRRWSCAIKPTRRST